VTTPLRSWLFVAGAVVCLAEIWIAGLPTAGYQILAGRHGWFESERAYLLQALLFGLPAVALLTAALAEPVGERLLAAFERAGHLAPREVSALVVCASALTLFLVTAVRYGFLKDAAISDDEHAYAFMGQMFASGRIYVPSLPPPLRAFLDNQFIVNNGKMYGIYFPGHPVALAIGERLHAMAWVPTLSATLTVPLAFGVARRLFGLRTAVLTLPLLLVSPYFLFPSATLLAHSTAAVLLMAFIYSILRLREEPDAIRWWVAAGIAVSWAAVTRPFSTPFFVGPWLLWLGVDLWRRRRTSALPGIVLFCLIGAGVLGLLLAYQSALSGSPFTSGYQTFSQIHRWALVGKALEAPPPLPSIHELMFTLARINFWLFGWPASLLLVPLFHRTEGGRRVFASVAMVILVYAVISAATIQPVGPVHYSELAVPLVILSASGLERLVELGRAAIGWAGAARAAVTMPLAATLCALVTFVPVYGVSLRASADLTRAPDDFLAERGIDRALVFVRGLPGLRHPPYSWAYYRRNNSPDLTDPILLVNHLGAAKNTELMRVFPDRPAFVLEIQGSNLVLRPAP
jgi:dolichyl-phosphate-mannose-protein mannosyltransferase